MTPLPNPLPLFDSTFRSQDGRRSLTRMPSEHLQADTVFPRSYNSVRKVYCQRAWCDCAEGFLVNVQYTSTALRTMHSPFAFDMMCVLSRDRNTASIDIYGTYIQQDLFGLRCFYVPAGGRNMVVQSWNSRRRRQTESILELRTLRFSRSSTTHHDRPLRVSLL